jgi:uroporphyrinogen-III synthase
VPIIWPAIVILPPPDRGPLEQAHAALRDYDIAVFVSANAVEFGAPAPNRWPAHIVTYAPGPGTAETLAAAGIPDARVPVTSLDSEGLLELPALADVTGKRIVIFRGEGGREFLGNTLRSRGAIVDHVPCYRRVAPQSGADGLVEAMRDGRAHAVTLTSSEGLDNLIAALGPAGCELLSRLPVFAAHPRIAERAREHGLRAVETAGGDGGLLAGLLEWFAGPPRATRSA